MVRAITLIPDAINRGKLFRSITYSLMSKDKFTDSNSHELCAAAHVLVKGGDHE